MNNIWRLIYSSFVLLSMISSQFNADGDHKIKRIKTIDSNLFIKKTLVEEFFYQTHPFSDLILIIQGILTIDKYVYFGSFLLFLYLDKELYVDKSVLAIGSKVFQTYFQDENIDSIEILDVTPNEMIELLQFFYPQFQCTINNENITTLLILGKKTV